MTSTTTTDARRRVPTTTARRLRVLVIGGIDRQEPQLARLGEESGHEVEFHHGGMGGRGAAALRARVARSDVVVIATDHNSHGAARLARREAQRFGKPSVLLGRCGVARFQALLRAADLAAVGVPS